MNLFKHQDLPISSCLSCGRGKASLNCSSVSMANILPRGNSGSAVIYCLYCSFILYFETPISFALSSKPHGFRYRRKDYRSHASSFVKKDHFIAGFSSPCLYIHTVTSWRTFMQIIAEAIQAWWEWNALVGTKVISRSVGGKSGTLGTWRGLKWLIDY